MFACQGIAHESAIGHAAGIGAFRTESMLLLEVLGQGHKEAMVIRGALVQVGVPVCDVEDVLRALWEDSDKPLLLCQRGESAVSPDELGTARVPMENKDKRSTFRNRIGSLHIVGPGDATMFEFKLAECGCTRGDHEKEGEEGFHSRSQFCSGLGLPRSTP